MPRHKLTTEERRQGQAKGAETKRVRREAAQLAAVEQLAGLVEQAVARLAELLDSEDGHVATRAVREVLDRVLGRPPQAVELSVDDMRADLSKLTDAELEQLRKLLVKARPDDGEL